jgi:beta-lactamase class C
MHEELLRADLQDRVRSVPEGVQDEIAAAAAPRQQSIDPCCWTVLLTRVACAGLALTMAADLHAVAQADTDQTVERLVAAEIHSLLPSDGIAGAAVAVRSNGRTVFFNYGWANSAQKQSITSDSLFNLASIRKVFEATLLAQAFQRGELAFDDPATKYVTELQQGRDIRRVTIGQLATHTSGLLLPQDHPPWPSERLTLPAFIRVLNDWSADKEQAPGKQHIYTHAGYVLLQLVLERRFGAPIGELLERRVIRPLGLTSTILPGIGAGGRAAFAPALAGRLVQGYDEDGTASGQPGDQHSYYDFSGTAQMFSSARDLATMMAAHLGELPVEETLREAMQLTHRPFFQITPRDAQGLAWEVLDHGGPQIVDKPGGTYNSSTYVGMIPSRNLGLVLLLNRGNQYAFEFGRRFLPELARRQAL